MRTWFYPVLITVIVVSLPACELAGPNAELPPDSVRQAYYEDAQQLAVREMAEKNDTSVEIPDAKVQPFYEALLAVYNARDIEARDSIVGIHTLPRYNLHEINVGVDTTVAWTQAWQSGRRLTGNEAIDTLMKGYDLTLKRYVDGIAVATLRSEDPLNPVGLSAKFDGIRGVQYAEQNGLGGDGGDIRAEGLDEALRLRYSRAWGDCPAGCIHRTIWTFRVEDDGTVTFEGKTST